MSASTPRRSATEPARIRSPKRSGALWRRRTGADMPIAGPNISTASSVNERTASDAEDRRIVALCKAGDRGAFNELIQRYEKKVYNFAFRLCGNYDDANDIASDSFLRVYNSLAGFRGDSSF